MGGEVLGPGADSSNIAVLFSSHTSPINVFPHEISRDALPIPDGYGKGDTVYYVSKDKRFANGSWLKPGLRGEVVGPLSDKCRVNVMFHGATAPVSVFLSEVSRKCPMLPFGY